MAKGKKASDPDRREFLSTAVMTAGLVSGYGAFALVSGRYLYPARPTDRVWQFVIEEERMAVGDAIVFRTPGGRTVNIARRRANGDADDFIALSSTCPHLGCRVTWETSRSCFFCPCHNGTFDRSGLGNGGPPGRARQSLPRYGLKLEEGLLHIEVESDQLAAGRSPVSRADRRRV